MGMNDQPLDVMGTARVFRRTMTTFDSIAPVYPPVPDSIADFWELNPQALADRMPALEREFRGDEMAWALPGLAFLALSVWRRVRRKNSDKTTSVIKQLFPKAIDGAARRGGFESYDAVRYFSGIFGFGNGRDERVGADPAETFFDDLQVQLEWLKANVPDADGQIRLDVLIKRLLVARRSRKFRRKLDDRRDDIIGTQIEGLPSDEIHALGWFLDSFSMTEDGDDMSGHYAHWIIDFRKTPIRLFHGPNLFSLSTLGNSESDKL